MQTTFSIIQHSLEEMWDGLIIFFPNVFGAVFIFLIGLLLAIALRKVVVRVVAMLRVDEFATKLEVKQSLQHLGLNIHIGRLFGWIVQWFFVIVFLIVATDILGWDQVTDYLKQVVFYLPNAVIAIVILLVGVFLGNFVYRVINSAETAKRSSILFFAPIAKWAILIFSFMAALVQLQIAQELIRILFTGLIAMFSLAGGLAFGLGGKEQAARVLEKFRKNMSSEEE